MAHELQTSPPVSFAATTSRSLDVQEVLAGGKVCPNDIRILSKLNIKKAWNRAKWFSVGVCNKNEKKIGTSAIRTSVNIFGRFKRGQNEGPEPSVLVLNPANHLRHAPKQFLKHPLLAW